MGQEMDGKPHDLRGLARLRAALRNSLAGLRDIWRGEEAFRIEAVIFALSIPAAIWLGESALSVAALIVSVLMLLIVEILNSAIEAVVDRIGPERHELSRIAKDLGSLAVLLAALAAGLIWLAVLWDRIAG